MENSEKQASDCPFCHEEPWLCELPLRWRVECQNPACEKPPMGRKMATRETALRQWEWACTAGEFFFREE